jgi:hypothetical protein
MSPIEGVSTIIRYPRLGKIRLGVKKEGQKGPYPEAVNFFVCPDEVKAVYQDRPTELRIMFPNDDMELIAPQYYKCYSHSQGLICKGTGKTCRRKVDTATGDFANRDTSEWDMADAVCSPDKCPMITSKQCRKVMSLMFILPDVPGLGVYQLDTTSFHSIVNINSQVATEGFIRHFTRGRIAYLPLILSLGPQEVMPPGVGRKTVHVLSVRAEVKLTDIIRISRQSPEQILLPTLAEDEPPAEEELLEDLFPPENEARPIAETTPPPDSKAQGAVAVSPSIITTPPAAETVNPERDALKTSTGQTAEPAWKSVTKDQVKGFTDLYRLCNQYFKVEKNGRIAPMTSVDVVRELGYSSNMDVRETPWECWLNIISTKGSRK